MQKDYTYIFDLDDTLFPTQSIKEEVGFPLLKQLIESNSKEKKYSKKEINKIYRDCWIYPLDQLSSKYNFTEIYYNNLHTAYNTIEVNHSLSLYDDASVLNDLIGEKYLVTTGYEKLQHSKIRLLKIEPYFKEIFIDSLNMTPRKGKKEIFNQILIRSSKKPSEIIVIGDNLDSEIKAGNELGLTTIHIKRDKNVSKNNAKYCINSLNELLTLNL
jgi:putative hydrolase of the HAD superfamily